MRTTLQMLLTFLLIVVNSLSERPSLVFEENFVQYSDGSGALLEGLLVYPKIAAELPEGAPAVIVFHALDGRTDFEDLKARDLAMLGYVAFAADLFGKGVAGNDTINDNFPIVLKLLDQRTSTLQSRILAALDAVKGLGFVNKQKIACIGFSFGGLSCVDLARLNVGLSAAVSFHGMIHSYPESNGTTSTSIQAHYGADDIYIETDIVEFVDELKALKADWHLTFYSDTVDGFTIPGVEKWGFIGYAYNEKIRQTFEYSDAVVSC